MIDREIKLDEILDVIVPVDMRKKWYQILYSE